MRNYKNLIKKKVILIFFLCIISFNHCSDMLGKEFSSETDSTTDSTTDPIIEAYTFSELDRIIAGDNEDNALFGSSVAISGDYAVVGSMNEDSAGNNSGAAYIYYRNEGGDNNWGQVKKLVSLDINAEDYFGNSVAISGDYIVVGAYNKENPNNPNNREGAAYVFYRQGGPDDWEQVFKLSDANLEFLDRFGYSVSISGDLVVIGAPGDDTNGGQSGIAYLYQRQGAVNNWTQVTQIEPDDGADTDQFGYSVSISENYAIIGAVGKTNEQGAAYIFSSVNNWNPQVARLVASDAAIADSFGYSVSISGGYAIVGAIYKDRESNLGDPDYGAAYVYSRTQGGANNWGEVTKLTPNDAAQPDHFGSAVAISSEYAVVGAIYKIEPGRLFPGAAYVFNCNQGGNNNWGQVNKLIANNPENGADFGCSVAISGPDVIVGAQREDGVGTNQGAAYIFGD